MSKVREVSLKDIKAEILKCLNGIGISVRHVILFGSRARVDYEDLSDYDLLIVIENQTGNFSKRKTQRFIYNYLHEVFRTTPFDIILKTEKEFNNEKKVVNTISNEVLLEGIEL